MDNETHEQKIIRQNYYLHLDGDTIFKRLSVCTGSYLPDMGPVFFLFLRNFLKVLVPCSSV